MSNLTSVFGSSTTTLDEVVLVPWGDYSTNSQRFEFSPHKLTDFEFIKVTATTSNGVSGGGGVETKQFSPEDMLSGTNVGVAESTRSAPFEGYAYVGLTAINNTGVSARVIASGSTYSAKLNKVVGYKKRHASMNVSNIVNVSGSASTTAGNMKFNERLEVDIKTELGADYIGKDLIVQAEVYNNTGTGVAGWGKVPFIFVRDGGSGTSYTSFGCEASVLGDKIVIKSGQHGLADHSLWGGTPFGNTIGIGDAPVRVKVWKIEQYIHNSATAAGASYVIENGQNANGYYRRWSDGYKEQWGRPLAQNNGTEAGGSKFMPYPVPFTDPGSVVLSGNLTNCTSSYQLELGTDGYANQYRTFLVQTSNGVAAPSTHKEGFTWSAKGY